MGVSPGNGGDPFPLVPPRVLAGPPIQILGFVFSEIKMNKVSLANDRLQNSFIKKFLMIWGTWNKLIVPEWEFGG